MGKRADGEILSEIERENAPQSNAAPSGIIGGLHTSTSFTAMQGMANLMWHVRNHCTFLPPKILPPLLFFTLSKAGGGRRDRSTPYARGGGNNYKDTRRGGAAAGVTLKIVGLG